MALMLSLYGLLHLTYHCYVTDNWIQHKFEIGPSKKAWAFNYDWKGMVVRKRGKRSFTPLWEIGT